MKSFGDSWKKAVARWGRLPGCLLILWIGVEDLPADSATNRFGFAGKEIFPIDYQISHLRSGDLNGDGLLDLIIVNNLRSKITLLYNQTGQTNLAESLAAKVKLEINELPPDARFRIESIASEKRISSLTVADFNGDQRPDLAYYGEPRELIVQFNEGNSAWSALKRIPIEDGLLNQNALVHGDINGDRRTDLLLLADHHLYLILQEENGTLAEPVRLPYSGPVLALQVLDIDGNGRQDLLLVNWDHPNPFRFRLQNSQGQLDPEIHFPLPPIRSYWADDLDRDGRAEVITIAQKSGRAQISHFLKKPAEAISGEWLKGQLEILPLPKTTKAKRGLAWADINHDQRPDLLVAQPESGQLIAYLQDAHGSFEAPRTFPALTGIGEIAAADWDGDGLSEIFLLSQDERQIGVTRWDEQGRLPFPTALAIEGRPLALTAGPLKAGGLAVLAVINEIEGKRELVIFQNGSSPRRQRLSDNFKSNPKSIAIHDLDQDGLNDLIVLIPYERIKVLIQAEGKDFEEIDVAPPGGSADQPWMSACDVDGDGKAELLLAQKNFVRAVVLEKNGGDAAAGGASSSGLTVKEQINGAASNSNIIGATALRNGTNTVDSLFLLDAERKALTLCERDASGVWQVERNLPLPVTDFVALQAVQMGGGNPAMSVAFLGNNAVAWMRLQGKTWELAELDGYETPIKDGFLLDVVSGDLNQDKRKDLVFLETRKNHIDVVTYEPPHQLVPANRWQVFEERSFRGRPTTAHEPREALVADFNNDGKNDLALVVHDRIIVYPQE